jgi:hypothetical protein
VVAYSQAPPRLANAQPVAQVVGRTVINPDFTVDLIGYFTALEGVPTNSLFSSATAQDENTAVLSYRADRVAARPFYNGSLIHALERPLQGTSTALRIYYNPTASKRDWADPATFAEGQEVALYQSRNASVAVYPGSYFATSGITLQSSQTFMIGNRMVNARDIANGMALTLTGPAPGLASIIEKAMKGESILIDQSGTGYSASN